MPTHPRQMALIAFMQAQELHQLRWLLAASRQHERLHDA